MIENIFDILDNLFRFIYPVSYFCNNNYQEPKPKYNKKKLSANECQIKLEVDQL